MIQVFRLQKARFSSIENILLGYGAELFGGRWNTIGHATVYTSASPELALLETLVHIEEIYLDDLPQHVLATIEIPSDSIFKVDTEILPENWNDIHISAATQQFTANWFAQQTYLAIALPSVIVPMSFNYLINPNHLRMKEVKVVEIIPFCFDSRLFK
jgi:RES domain-containing protein